MTPCINRKCTRIKNVFHNVKKIRHYVLTENVPFLKMYLIKKLQHQVLTKNVPYKNVYNNVKTMTPCINRKCYSYQKCKKKYDSKRQRAPSQSFCIVNSSFCTSCPHAHSHRQFLNILRFFRLMHGRIFIFFYILFLFFIFIFHLIHFRLSTFSVNAWCRSF